MAHQAPPGTTPLALGDPYVVHSNFGIGTALDSDLFFSTGLAAQTAQKQKSRTPKAP